MTQTFVVGQNITASVTNKFQNKEQFFKHFKHSARHAEFYSLAESHFRLVASFPCYPVFDEWV